MKSEEIALNQIGAFVPFPTALLDEQMPKLKDTEWRLLCVVVRQTLGWKEGSGRKKRDWMTQKQLIARTGRNSAALSAALEALVRKGLVECRGASGESLVTPQQRCKHRGRVYFSLSPALFTLPEPAAPQPQTNIFNPERVYQGWTKADGIVQDRYRISTD